MAHEEHRADAQGRAAWVWPAIPPMAVLLLGGAMLKWICNNEPPAQLKPPLLAVAHATTNVVCDPPTATNAMIPGTNTLAQYCLTGQQAIAGPASAAEITACIAWLALVIVCIAVVTLCVLELVQLVKLKGGAIASGIAVSVSAVVAILIGSEHTYALFGGADAKTSIFAQTVCSSAYAKVALPFTGDPCGFNALIYTGAVASVVAAVFAVITVCVLHGVAHQLKPEAQASIRANKKALVDYRTEVAVAAAAPPAPGHKPHPTPHPPVIENNPLNGYDDKLKYLLFGVSAVLFLGVFCLRAWNNWPETFYVLPNEKLGAQAYDQTLQAYVNIQAVTYVFLLLAAFGPVAYSVRRAGAPPSGTTPTGPASLWTESLQKTLALLAPILAVPINALLASFTQGWGKF